LERETIPQLLTVLLGLLPPDERCAEENDGPELKEDRQSHGIESTNGCLSLFAIDAGKVANLRNSISPGIDRDGSALPSQPLQHFSETQPTRMKREGIAALTTTQLLGLYDLHRSDPDAARRCLTEMVDAEVLLKILRLVSIPRAGPARRARTSQLNTSYLALQIMPSDSAYADDTPEMYWCSPCRPHDRFGLFSASLAP
jgi:hypothetical protein